MVNSGNPSKDCVTIQLCYSLHEASQKPKSTITMASGEISGDLYSDRRAHQQERLPPIYIPVETSPEKKLYTGSHALIYSPAQKFTHQRMAVRVPLFLHAPPPEGAPTADKPIHPLQAPCHRRKSLSFSVFLFGHCYCIFLSLESPLFLCFLELYDIFRTLGVVSVDFY